ncbi:MAG TPA: ectonucleotide pyrophosphatase/phosphodiesterase [Vicinamibacterales bacterium]|jgi:predicted AlkP superfamily pyrophosphatase or phosphodiesterase|nr:ectonucleotide pyrophosphatase/phosphodiesterase [Vicinamibacterales bacterium]
MRRSRPLIALLSLVAATVALAAGPDVHVLMISVDGMMPASYTSPGPARIPVIRALVAEGASAQGVISVLPSVTYPAHTTLVTGVSPAVHGILNNGMFDPEDRSGNASNWYASAIQVPTLLGAAHSSGLKTGAVTWPVTVGMDIDFHVPEFWRTNFGNDHPESVMFLKVASTPHLLDAIEIARRQPLPGRLTDADRLDMAKFILATYQPNLMLVHFVELDTMQHNTGLGSPESLATLERIDGYIGTLLKTLTDGGLRERTHVLVVSDHGFLPISKRLQVNTLFKQERLLETDDRGRIRKWEAYFYSTGGSGFVFLKNPRDQPLVSRIREMLEKLRADPANGIRTIWSREEIAQLGSFPDAVLGIDMQSGFYTGGGHDSLLAGVAMNDGRAMSGGHGFDPRRPELYASLVVSGPDARGRGNLGVVRMTQIAPTVARWLGVGLSPLADQPLEKMLPAAGAQPH